MDAPHVACACDACAVRFSPGEARTQEGLCGFCSVRCFPLGTMGATTQRVALDRTSRLRVHRAETPPRHHDARVRVAQAIYEEVRPYAEPALKSIGRQVLRKLFGR